MAVTGAVAEVACFQAMEKSMGLAAEPFHQGKGGTYINAGKALTVAGLITSVLGRRSRAVSAVAGAALMAASASTRFGIFHAGQESARDPKYTVVPQRERLNARNGHAADHAASVQSS
jgi:hypothetical protein